MTAMQARGGWMLVGAVGAVALGGLALYGVWRLARRSERARRSSHLARYGAGVTTGIYDDVAQSAKDERYTVGEPIDADALVDEALDDSFPASDPPSFTAR